MNTSKNQLYEFASRGPNEMVSFFEIIIFLRPVPGMEDAPEESVHGTHMQVMTREGIALMHQLHIINRIFRAWYQITWGERMRDESFFSGETPRMECGDAVPDIHTGHAMLSVALSLTDPSYPLVLPLLYEREALEAYGGAFGYGCHELDIHPDAPVVAPNFDTEFRGWADTLRARYAREKGARGAEGVCDEGAYLRFFLETCGEHLMVPFARGLSEDERAGYAQEASNIIRFYAREQATHGEYIRYDIISRDLWDMLRGFDATILSEDDMRAYDREAGMRMRGAFQTEAYAHSIATFHRLHHTMDKCVLFPLDRYFNAVEVVWQDKDLFAQNMATLYGLVNAGKSALPWGRIPKDRLVSRALREADKDLESNRLDRQWFNPGTCFRFLERAHPHLV